MDYIIPELETCPPHCAHPRCYPSSHSHYAFPCRSSPHPHPPPHSQHHPSHPHG